mmetsp:Transcript_62548/g.104088  ORF Transcript_62548/g.104088 Transcript_62548/m.104088 type:complete len:136 (-) Transcript_62548:72-479(-)
MFNPMMHAHNSQQYANGNINELLEDFNALFDTDWVFLLAIAFCMFSFVGILLTSLIMVLAPFAITWLWKLVFIFCCIVFFIATVFLIEPRPSHWLTTLGQIEHWLWTRTLVEQRMRVRRWWRWRKKYAMRTKLNV